MGYRDKIRHITEKRLTLRPLHCDLTGDEKKLQQEFSDSKLRLRWNWYDQNYQIWNFDPHDIYCIFTLPADGYDYSKVKRMLRDKEQSQKKASELFNEKVERDQKTEDQRITDAADEMARGIMNIENNKLSMSV